MKKILNKIVCCIIAGFCIFSFTACEKQTKYPGLDSETKSYYSKNGYVSFAASSDLNVITENDDDILNFDDGTSMVKEKANLQIKPVGNNFVLTDFGYYIDFKAGKVLSKIDINGKLYSYIDKDFDKYTVSGAVDFKAVINDFNVVGVMCMVDTNYISNEKDVPLNQKLTVSDSISVKSDYRSQYSLYYSYLSKETNFDIVSSNKFKSNLTFNCKKSDDDKNINFIFELFFNKSVTSAYIVLKDSENRLFIQEMDFDTDANCFTLNNQKENDTKGYEKFTLSFDRDLDSLSSY